MTDLSEIGRVVGVSKTVRKMTKTGTKGGPPERGAAVGRRGRSKKGDFVSLAELAERMGVVDRTLRNYLADAKRKLDANAPVEAFTPVEASLIDATSYQPTPKGHSRWTRAGAAKVLKLCGRPVPPEWSRAAAG